VSERLTAREGLLSAARLRTTAPPGLLHAQPLAKARHRCQWWAFSVRNA
jgi:hypothetical protein